MDEARDLFLNLYVDIQRFHSKNADLDASGVLDMSDVLLGAKKLDLYFKGDFKALWQLEHKELSKLRTEIIECEEQLSVTITDIEASLEFRSSEREALLERELTISARCVKRLFENYRKECMAHEETRMALQAAATGQN